MESTNENKKSSYNEKGEEVLDPTPIKIPAIMRPAMTLNERILMLTRQELSRAAQAGGMDSFEEADDFEIDDDIPLESPWEEHFDPDIRFIASKEQEIKHRARKDFDDDQIQRGMERLKWYEDREKRKRAKAKYNKEQAAKKAKSSQDDDAADPDDQDPV